MASDPNTTAASGNTRPFSTAITNAQPTRPNMSPVPYPHPHLHPHHHQSLYTGPQPIRPTPNHPQQPSSLSQGIPYPVASSGRGFIPKPPTVAHAVTVAANPGSVSSAAAVAAYTPRPIIPYPHGLSHPVHALRPPHHQHHHLHPAQLGNPGLGPVPISVKGVPVSSPHSKGFPPSLVADSNGYRDTRDRSRDDTLVTVRDRKVRITDGASLYALCRSWLRNGSLEESKPQYGDPVKCLPKPLPLAVPATNLPKKEPEEEEETEDKENEESVEHLSPRSLLKRHVKHARKVRARLREERLRRIARYKTRLALLLPPLVEQFRSDTAPRN